MTGKQAKIVKTRAARVFADATHADAFDLAALDRYARWTRSRMLTEPLTFEQQMGLLAPPCEANPLLVTDEDETL